MYLEDSALNLFSDWLAVSIQSSTDVYFAIRVSGASAIESIESNDSSESSLNTCSTSASSRLTMMNRSVVVLPHKQPDGAIHIIELLGLINC